MDLGNRADWSLAGWLQNFIEKIKWINLIDRNIIGDLSKTGKFRNHQRSNSFDKLKFKIKFFKVFKRKSQITIKTNYLKLMLLVSLNPTQLATPTGGARHGGGAQRGGAARRFGSGAGGGAWRGGGAWATQHIGVERKLFAKLC